MRQEQDVGTFAEASRSEYRMLAEATLAIQEPYMRLALGIFAGQAGLVRALLGQSVAQREALHAPPGDPEDADLPIEGYDRLDADGLGRELKGLRIDEVERLRAYEKRTMNRRHMLERLDRSLV